MPVIRSDDVISRSPEMVARKTGNEYVLVPVTDNVADMDSVFTLNETGAFIWEHIDGKRSVKDLIESLVKEYNTDQQTASADLLSFLEEMKKYLIIKL